VRNAVEPGECSNRGTPERLGALHGLCACGAPLRARPARSARCWNLYWVHPRSRRCGGWSRHINLRPRRNNVGGPRSQLHALYEGKAAHCGRRCSACPRVSKRCAWSGICASTSLSLYAHMKARPGRRSLSESPFERPAVANNAVPQNGVVNPQALRPIDQRAALAVEFDDPMPTPAAGLFATARRLAAAQSGGAIHAAGATIAFAHPMCGRASVGRPLHDEQLAKALPGEIDKSRHL